MHLGRCLAQVQAARRLRWWGRGREGDEVGVLDYCAQAGMVVLEAAAVGGVVDDLDRFAGGPGAVEGGRAVADGVAAHAERVDAAPGRAGGAGGGGAGGDLDVVAVLSGGGAADNRSPRR